MSALNILGEYHNDGACHALTKIVHCGVLVILVSEEMIRRKKEKYRKKINCT